MFFYSLLCFWLTEGPSVRAAVHEMEYSTSVYPEINSNLKLPSNIRHRSKTLRNLYSTSNCVIEETEPKSAGEAWKAVSKRLHLFFLM